MAFGASSKVFVATIEAMVENASAFNLSSDTFKIALYGNSGTPDATVAIANTAYGAGQWVHTSNGTNEVWDGTEWAEGGQEVAIASSGVTSNVYKWDITDEVSAGTSATLSVYGALLYDTTISSYGICYLSFGGTAQSVTDGTFTVVFSSNGAFTITV